MSKEQGRKAGEKRVGDFQEVKAEDSWLKEKLKKIEEIKIWIIKIKFFE